MTELNGFCVFAEDFDDLPIHVRFDLVHQLHRLDDTDHLTTLDLITDPNKGLRVWTRSRIERADDRGGELVDAGLGR